MKKILVFILLFSSGNSLSSMNNRYGGKDARRNNLIAQKVTQHAAKFQQKNTKKIELQKARLAEIATRKSNSDQQKLVAHNTNQIQQEQINYPSSSWKSNLFFDFE